MLIESTLTDEQKAKIRRLAWTALSKGVVSFFVAIGTEIGKRLVERVVGDDDDEDEDDEDPAE